MIRFKKVNKQFANGHQALRNVSFHINKGELAFLTGHSGAGKSTILNIVAMTESISSGEVLINGKSTHKIKRRQLPYIRRAIGFISQSPTLLWQQSVFDNVALPMMVSGYRQNEINKRVRAALDKVGLLPKEKMACVALSTGEQQRVAIARAVVVRPALILADEPTGNLDPKLSKEILSLFEAFNDIGTSVLIATHDLPLISRLPHRIITLNQGQLSQPGEV